ncbi:hypothetical protein M405DRAFT_804398 [Rhizopogon salebrosus TDB-379]|nr:hypothetical protein M405DRAFT_804398 [Rhizopogon salebrosus TDB-379]
MSCFVPPRALPRSSPSRYLRNVQHQVKDSKVLGQHALSGFFRGPHLSQHLRIECLRYYP